MLTALTALSPHSPPLSLTLLLSPLTLLLSPSLSFPLLASLFPHSFSLYSQGPSILFDAQNFIPLDPTQEPIFPAALKVNNGLYWDCISVMICLQLCSPLKPLVILLSLLQLCGPLKPLAIRGPRVQWYRPTTLHQLLELRSRFPHHAERDKPQHRMVVGYTEIGQW